MKLYEHAQDLEQAVEWLIEAGGELTPEVLELLEQAETAFDEKAERVGLKARELAVLADAVDAEVDRLAARAKSLRSSSKGLLTYLHQQMLSADRPEVKRPLLTLRVQNSPASVRCLVPVDELPAELVRVVPEARSFDAKAALSLHRAGHALPAGVEIVQNTHLRLY